MTMTMTTGPSTSVPAEPEAIGLYDAIGGRASLVAAVDVFYRRVLADPGLSPFSRAAWVSGTGRILSHSSARPWAARAATGDATSPRRTVTWASTTPSSTASPATLTPPWTSLVCPAT